MPLKTSNVLAQLEERLRFETLIADLSSKFVNLPAGEVDGEILDAERRICEVLGLDVSALWQWSVEQPDSFTLTHFYDALGGPRPPERMDASEHFPWCQKQVLAGRIIQVASLATLPSEAARDQETWRQLGIKTSLTLPLAVGGEPPIGALSFNTVRAERDWPDALVKRLQLLAQVFTHALARKRAEETLRENEERMRLAVEAAALGVWVWSLARNRVWGSERWLGLFGFASGEAISFEMILRRIHPDDRGTVEREVRHALASQGDYAGEFRAVLPDGTQRWVASRGRGYADANGKPARMLGAAIDISERKRAEEAFCASEARLEACAGLAGLGCYEVNFIAPSVFSDDRMSGICGFAPGKHQGLKWLQFWMDHLHPDDRQRVMDEREKLHDGRHERLSIEYRYLHPTEGVRWLHHAARISERDAAGRALRTYGALRDVTAQKQAEEAARDLSGRLLRAQEAERARIAKELHDGLSQNLALLSVELEMFGQRLPDSADQINARVAEFSRHTKGLSAEVHRISHGLHPAKLTQLGLEVALKGFCREVATAHGISVRFAARDVPRGLPEDVALCLYRVAQEAVQNIVKHSGAKQAQVELMALGGALALTITDDGQGFVVGPGRATGSLGLVSMHERVRLVQGVIVVNSQPGEGTRIEVHVPLPKETKS